MNQFTVIPQSLRLDRRRDDSHPAAPAPHLFRCEIGAHSERFLDEYAHWLTDESLTQAALRQVMSEAYAQLRQARLTLDPAGWAQLVTFCRNHPVRRLLHEDPFTYRAFAKPRGYAGDAPLLDLIYAAEERRELPTMSALGRRIFDCTTDSSACNGVKARRGFVAEYIDRLAESTPRPDVLSLACGHLREAGLSSAALRGRLGRIVGLDVDSVSLDEVRRCYGRLGVEAVAAEVRELISGRIDLGHFDLIYSTGLFDYLHQNTARRLTSRLFQQLKPGGSLIAANFLPHIECVGYMEAFMDWNLIYRDRIEMIELTREIDEHDVGLATVFAEENCNVVLLLVTRRG